MAKRQTAFYGSTSLLIVSSILIVITGYLAAVRNMDPFSKSKQYWKGLRIQVVDGRNVRFRRYIIINDCLLQVVREFVPVICIAMLLHDKS